MSKELPADPVDRVALLAADFGAAADEVDDAAAAALRVNRTDLRLLGLVGEGSLSAGALAVAAGLSPAATTTAVQRLVAAGHLVREVDPADRRRVTLTVTASSADLLRRAYEPVADEGRRILAGYPTADLAVIDRFLRAGIDLQRAHAVRIRAIG